MNKILQKNSHSDFGQNFGEYDSDLSNSNLKTTILEKIKTQNMVSSNLFRIYNIFLFLGILILSSLSIILLAGFLADLNEINAISEDFWTNLWQNSFLEFIILAFLIGFLIYVIYRQTDWILVRHKRILLGGILIFIAIFGIIGSFFIQKNLETFQNLENLGHRQNRIANLGQKMKEKNAFIGKIMQINKEENWLKIGNKKEVKTFYWQNESQNESQQNESQNENLDHNLINQSKLAEKNFPKQKTLPKDEKKLDKNQHKIPNQNWQKLIDKLEIDQKVLLSFEQIEDKMIIINLRII